MYFFTCFYWEENLAQHFSVLKGKLSIACIVTIDLKLTETRYHKPQHFQLYPNPLFH